MFRYVLLSVTVLFAIFGRLAPAQEEAPDLPRLIVADEALEIVGRYQAEFEAPPKRIPTNKVVDGPLLGNGDIGITIAGDSSRHLYCIGKNDFWSEHPHEDWVAKGLRRHQNKRVITVGSVKIDIPTLEGASFHRVQDLLTAEIRGEFKTEDSAAIRTRSWTAEGENLLVTEIENAGDKDLRVHASNAPGEIRGFRDNDQPIRIGRENYRDGRWYFDGAIDEVRIYDRTLSADEITALANLKDVEEGLVRYWPLDEAEGDEAREATGNDEGAAIKGGAKWIEGRRGSALELDGESGYLRAGPTQLRSGVTVSMWVRPNSFSGAASADKRLGPDDWGLVSSWLGAQNGKSATYVLSKGEWNRGISLGFTNDGTARFAVGSYYRESVQTIGTDSWQHIAAASDGREINLYIDGRPVIANAGGASKTPPMPYPTQSGVTDGVTWFTRSANPQGVAGRRVAVATRILGPEVDIHDRNELAFALKAGEKAKVVSVIYSDIDAGNYEDAAIERAAALNDENLKEIDKERLNWWRRFWSESFVDLGDPFLEKYYYASHHILACASQSGETPPGLFGNWITTDHPGWLGDYHFNYNHEAPWWGVYSSNHISISDPYDEPILDFIDKGREYARQYLDCRGVYYPVGIGPWGMTLRREDPIYFWNQKSNALFCTMNMLMRFYHTYDKGYVARVYPFLIEVADFWEDYLKFEDGRYVVHDDCIWESKDDLHMNPLLTLSMLRRFYRGMLDMSVELGRDADRRSKWGHILENLSELPRREVEGELRFCQAEGGENGGRIIISNPGCKGLLWPGRLISLESPPELLRAARNEVENWSDQFWHRDNNGFPSTYPGAVRVGYDAETILQNMRRTIEMNALPNLWVFQAGGGIETCSGVPATINEMLLLSHRKVLRLFPVWPKDQPARFGNLRAPGAFLVTSELRDGAVVYADILSEKGKDLTLVNPWPETGAAVYRNGEQASEQREGRFMLTTKPGERILLLPVGAIPSDIQ